ncbi:MAG: hypothetical protein ACHQ52_14735 [Candidatus Eisenbacteria bacterium]
MKPDRDVSRWPAAVGHPADPGRLGTTGARRWAIVATLAIAAATACVSTNAFADEAASTRIGEVLDAYGGRAALARVHAYRAEGRFASEMRQVTVHTVRVFSRPDRLKVLIDYPGHPEARLVDGRRGWRTVGPGPLEPSEGPMLDAMILQAARANVPWVLAERESLARVVEGIERDGVKLDGIEIPLDHGLLLRVYVNPVTRRVAMSQGVLSHAGMSTHFETMYSDFRQVSGVLFGFKEENWASGEHTGTTTLERIVIDPPLKLDEFTPPPAKDAKGKGAS